MIDTVELERSVRESLLALMDIQKTTTGKVQIVLHAYQNLTGTHDFDKALHVALDTNEDRHLPFRIYRTDSKMKFTEAFSGAETDEEILDELEMLLDPEIEKNPKYSMPNARQCESLGIIQAYRGIRTWATIIIIQDAFKLHKEVVGLND